MMRTRSCWSTFLVKSTSLSTHGMSSHELCSALVSCAGTKKSGSTPTRAANQYGIDLVEVRVFLLGDDVERANFQALGRRQQIWLP